ncbi:restriction endonuclease [Kyrpidia tusciae]|uniref:Restriction endonuclease n=1 Tax=Kyrpidia tusciae (strain DSM 2912 / NBRC 15312 / T2) TaxID=562970 RepID=D5WQ35_KYRT2|nr:restriction endonuclease [Kyrpidia tusciae]ADG06444.1 restriction endonuclease [Kyrpidia tusciae DSM 2912]
MSVPDYQSIMLPLLKITEDCREHRLNEVIETLSSQFLLTDSDRKELLPSGRQPKFDNRVGWARTYLVKAGLLESTGRGKFRITERGLEVLRTNPNEINNRFLSQFPEFLEFKNRTSTQGADDNDADLESLDRTPEEILDSTHLSLRKSLADELLERIKNCTPKFFERLVVDLLVAMGYGGSRVDAGQALGQSGDDGIDGMINEDRLGLDVIYLQAKRWEGTVGRPIVQAFAGSLEGQRARKGILITTSRFSQDAKEYVTRIEKKIVLIDGEQLANLMIDFNVGVTEVTRYVIKKVDLDYFDEGGLLSE